MTTLKTRDIIALGFMTFALFLGAGNIIFPPIVGTRHALQGLDGAGDEFGAGRRHDTGAYLVAVQYCAHFVGRYVDVALVVIPDHEAVAFTVALDYTFNFF